ncbi:hypothetical protein [Nocardia sp. NPDC058666]|uniref:hypothetical protein n=1 Tax=Nocardia sp. NPDC058666 TaxID=3346587 RepID=UPI003669E897
MQEDSPVRNWLYALGTGVVSLIFLAGSAPGYDEVLVFDDQVVQSYDTCITIGSGGSSESDCDEVATRETRYEEASPFGYLIAAAFALSSAFSVREALKGRNPASPGRGETLAPPPLPLNAGVSQSPQPAPQLRSAPIAAPKPSAEQTVSSYTLPLSGSVRVALRMRSSAPPANARDLGLTLTVMNGQILHNGQRTATTTLWSNDLTNGTTVEFHATGPAPIASFTPVRLDSSTGQTTANTNGVRVETGTPTLLHCNTNGHHSTAEFVVEIAQS